MHPKLLLLQAGLLLALTCTHAQTTPYAPSRAEILARYHKARSLDSIATRSIFKTTIRPHWSAETFEFLPLPGSDHTDGGPYGRVQRRDFFVRHLLGVEPPNRNMLISE